MEFVMNENTIRCQFLDLDKRQCESEPVALAGEIYCERHKVLVASLPEEATTPALTPDVYQG
jgi:hypothetical protein